MITKLLKPQPNFSYPLMRDPKRNPKCYEMTDEERKEATQRVEKILANKKSEPYFVNESGLKISAVTGELVND
jgi:hypothetical protein